MLAIPAPATLPTNCRRDIVNGASPGTLQSKRAFVVFIDCVIYPTEAVNDQAITTSSAGRGSNAVAWTRKRPEGAGFALMQCGIRGRSNWNARFGAEPLGGAAIPGSRLSAR
jgi:hypothetical protein